MSEQYKSINGTMKKVIYRLNSVSFFCVSKHNHKQFYKMKIADSDKEKHRVQQIFGDGVLNFNIDTVNLFLKFI